MLKMWAYVTSWLRPTPGKRHMLQFLRTLLTQMRHDGLQESDFVWLLT